MSRAGTNGPLARALSKARRAAASVASASVFCREHGMSSASFYKWRAKFGGMDASMISEMKALAEENRRLKRMYAEMGTYLDGAWQSARLGGCDDVRD